MGVERQEVDRRRNELLKEYAHREKRLFEA